MKHLEEIEKRKEDRLARKILQKAKGVKKPLTPCRRSKKEVASNEVASLTTDLSQLNTQKYIAVAYENNWYTGMKYKYLINVIIYYI